ncbi:MAG TPA: trypsin-like serine protease [Myxococcaceae bacterium]|nr:trypsin-like serine protease [Myxococcaceae bacterium]
MRQASYPVFAGRTAAAAAVLLWACGILPRESAETRPGAAEGSSEIVGGTTDLGDPEVFILEVQYSTGQTAVCSATLIGERSLVTAAHCVDPGTIAASGVSIRATNRWQVSTALESEWIRIVETRAHPEWIPGASLKDDVALALLASAPGAPRKPWNRASLSTYEGKPVRAVGYGISGKTASDWGLKRQVPLVINSVDGAHLYVGDGVDAGICHGDSGGPTFHVFADNVERLVGIHSYDANQQCTSGADVRVDAYAGFIDDWLLEKESPTCAVDGMCRRDCAPFDPDCSPPECAADGVCAMDECLAPDVDCVEIGQPCASALQCRSRECVEDSQHAGSYCSRPCHARAACPEEMECSAQAGVCVFPQLPVAAPGGPCVPGSTFCTNGTVCAGSSPLNAWCAGPCGVDSDCGPTATCDSGFAGERYCRPRRDVVPVTLDPLPVRGGCAATGGVPVLLLALIGWALCSRRAAFPSA